MISAIVSFCNPMNWIGGGVTPSSDARSVESASCSQIAQERSVKPRPVASGKELQHFQLLQSRLEEEKRARQVLEIERKNLCKEIERTKKFQTFLKEMCKSPLFGKEMIEKAYTSFKKNQIENEVVELDSDFCPLTKEGERTILREIFEDILNVAADQYNLPFIEKRIWLSWLENYGILNEKIEKFTREIENLDKMHERCLQNIRSKNKMIEMIEKNLQAYCRKIQVPVKKEHTDYIHARL